MIPFDDPEFWLELKRIEEAARTSRWRWLSGCATIGLIAVVVGVVKIVDKPAWVEIVVLLIFALIGPSGVIQTILKSRKRYIEKHHPRVVERERLRDPNRESSKSDIAEQIK